MGPTAWRQDRDGVAEGEKQEEDSGLEGASIGPDLASRGLMIPPEHRPVMSRTDVPISTQRDLTLDCARDGSSKVLLQGAPCAQNPVPASTPLSSASVFLPPSQSEETARQEVTTTRL